MTNTKFVVKVNRGGTRAPEYVQRVDPTPIHMTTNRKLALLMGRFMAEDAVKSMQTSRQSCRKQCMRRYMLGDACMFRGWLALLFDCGSRRSAGSLFSTTKRREVGVRTIRGRS